MIFFQMPFNFISSSKARYSLYMENNGTFLSNIQEATAELLDKLLYLNTYHFLDVLEGSGGSKIPIDPQDNWSQWLLAAVETQSSTRVSRRVP